MRAWTAPDVPTLPATGPAVAVHDTATGGSVTLAPEGAARLYVCGITPYDATHIGHANTYVAFDLLNRAWRSAGHDVTYVQNVTDVDDPLLERADKVGIAWEALAERETELFRTDMEALRVLPPAEYVGAVESIPLVIELIQRLEQIGAVYRVDEDLYYSVAADDAFGEESNYDRETMTRFFAERGGDPERAGKKDRLDALVWRGERPGEPAWDSPWGKGRPGWHIECAAIALKHLGGAFDVQGGGSDLIFPHHEMCAGHVQAVTGEPFARAYSHAGMVAYDGQKMSKSLGNLVFVSALRNSDVDPMAIRLTLMRHHYRDDWEWTDDQLWKAVDDLGRWRQALSGAAGAPADEAVAEVLEALASDIDAPRATAAVDRWVDATLSGDASDAGAPAAMRAVLDGALGVLL
ncbi:MAG: cysteine--1-D-myo-inosityl 2-amino-2-deoxy-alpha-D-glucopyranoside ligase [Nocardioidaceae bacterium]|nr:cysteine--1-D-myo-inosityl 2-amino-2-deoxy-alpha-D-glucopyranoside ligase [Nocardioidaceae bacterium]MCL2613391.1 cysteine--1-D-myo-inosityl 2-amino-2-deoxy-alpha-D-glucopyranoside ligase [Nocardioidaceae bacterium]